MVRHGTPVVAVTSPLAVHSFAIMGKFDQTKFKTKSYWDLLCKTFAEKREGK